MSASYAAGRGFTLTRRFDAPPELVFEAWTDPDGLDWFFNPGMPHDGPATVDLRVGGEWRLHMVVNATTQYMTGGVYREIVPNRKLVFSWGARDGWPALDLARLDDSPLATVLLTPVGRQTEMVFHLQLPDQMAEAAVRDWLATGMQNGWGITIDRLVTRLAERPGTQPAR